MSYNNNTLLHSEHHNLLPQKAGMSSEEIFIELCRYMGIDPRSMKKFLQCLPDVVDSIDCLPKVKSCLPTIERFPNECKTMTTQVESCLKYFKETSCAAQILYGQVTMTHHSQDLVIPLDQVVQGLGGDYTNAFPVQSGKRVRVRQKSRPGYRPLFVRGDFNFDQNSLAYSDISLQFFIGEKSIGAPFTGDNLLQKSGNQLKLDFPKYLHNQLVVGSNELLEVDIINNAVATLNSAHIRVHHDSKLWFEQCTTPC